MVAHELQNSVDNRLETLQNFLVGEGHVAFFNSSLGELGLNTNIHGPLLTVIPEVGLDSVLKVHDALGVHLASSLGTIRELHLTDLGAEDV